LAFNIQTFRTRALTAAVFVVVMLAGLLVSHWTFFLLFSVIHFGCWIEYQHLISKIDEGYRQTSWFHKAGFALLGWSIVLYFTDNHFNISGISLHSLGWWLSLILLFVLPLTEFLFNTQIRPRTFAYSFFALLYISASIGLLIDLLFAHPQTIDASNRWFPLIPLLIIASIWINDTMAYLVGSLIGKTPFSPISPKKTWEGTIGGVILSVATIAVCARLSGWFDNFTMLDLVMTPLIASIAGTAGDLFESKLKRMAQVKDSGSIMPGHGGFLDRFDSLLFAVPCVWLYYAIAHNSA
jgi:phosphatidate cytidylyltransferase